jgi:hypothetical protein
MREPRVSRRSPGSASEAGAHGRAWLSFYSLAILDKRITSDVSGLERLRGIQQEH